MPMVSIKGHQKTYKLDENEIIYHGLERQGETLPHGCLAGSCGACRIEILSGENELSPPSFIEQNTIEGVRTEMKKISPDIDHSKRKIRLACRAKIKGDIEIQKI
ncbi:MAG: (2Fe-2S)-binding protein [Bacteriovoracaceae bacterium]|nr:(2Fe-2S)-binding protein [Bacteriovoracaceae bacterium]